MEIALKPEIERLIESEVKAGHATDSGEFLQRAVYHYVIARDLGEEYSLEELDRLIAEGLDDIENGRVIDGEECFRELRALSAERRQQRA